MNATSRPRLVHRLRRPATLALVTALSAGLAGLVSAAPAGAGPGGRVAGVEDLPPTSIRIIQANLLSGQPDAKFAADLGNVFAQAPDFITYNEVPRRPDGQLAPEGYDLFRTPGTYTGATPIAWRTDRFEAIAAGTRMISNRWGKTRQQSVHWGVRYANWVTVREYTTGRVVSAISTHLAPKSPITEGLAKPSVRRLGALAATLAASGPVLIGGDFNFHYTSRVDYPRGVLAEQGLTPTYDVTGTYAPTGDHHQATIDYIFMHKAESFEVRSQTTTELNSDHDAVTVDVGLLTNPPAPAVSFRPGQLRNNPAGPRKSRRAVLNLLINATNAAPPGAGIHLEVAGLADKRLYAALNKAVDRGVYVQFLTRRHHPNYLERALFARLGHKLRTRSWAVDCLKACRRIESRRALPPTRLLVSTAGATRALRIDSDQAAASAAAKNPTTAVIRITARAYDKGYRSFLKLVGRSY